MNKAIAYDIVFIILLAIVLVIINEFDTQKELFKFRYIGFFTTYVIGRYVSKIIYKK